MRQVRLSLPHRRPHPPALLFDDGLYTELDAELASSDPLHFVDQKTYKDRCLPLQAATSLKDALISGHRNSRRPRA